MHLRRTVAAAGKTIAEAEERAFCLSNQARERLDLFDRHAADGRSPFRRAGRKMRLKLARAIGVALHIVAVGKTFAEQYMHDTAGKRAVGARPQDDLDVGLLPGVVVVDIDRRDLGAAFFAGAHRVPHPLALALPPALAPPPD